ncbi:MAG: hypothetical protein VCF25_29355 [Candidatus Poribacteria bacterium]|nr:hypothetical protein [Candidatus Poribacteria bacterium]HIM10535.1 hypothetical protein [Candidatus Poribacteria bacterium]HIN28038.1 hypothetical protein [Candidatus Poribacteria bacterium]
MRTKLVLVVFLCVCLGIFTTCSNDEEETTEQSLAEAPSAATWLVIQDQILSRRCVSCHQDGTSEALQSELILTPDVAYNQLINRTPKNLTARAGGLTLIGTEGSKSLAKSFLWEKINAPNEDHFYQDHPSYGTIMPPPPLPPLTYGELEFIRKWIIEGVPKAAVVADPRLLENIDQYQPQVAFVPPLPPKEGKQLHVKQFEIQPNSEREFFYYQPLNNPEPIYINQVEVSMKPGSHHFLIYGFQRNTPAFMIPQPHIYRELRDANGNYILATIQSMRFHTFVAGTQWPKMNYEFPAGIALKIPANYGFDLNSHYVNRTNSEVAGEVYVNLHYADPKQIEHTADVIAFTNFDIRLPPHQITTLQKTFNFKKRVHIFQLFSHAHELNTEFRVEISGGARNGEEIYFTDDWEHPPILELDPPLVLDAGRGFKLIATYNNTRDKEVGFGFLSTDEMMILFGLYYTD